MQVQLRDQKQFYISMGSEEAQLDFIIKEGSVMSIHRTFVPTSLRGRGLAQKLVEEALAYAQKNNYHIEALCSYVESYLKRKKA